MQLFEKKACSVMFLLRYPLKDIKELEMFDIVNYTLCKTLC